MKKITDINDDVLFLGAVYDAVEAVKDLIDTGNFKEIYTNSELSNEKKVMLFLKKGMKDYPEKTVAALRALMVREEIVETDDEGNEKRRLEDYPHGFELIKYGYEILTDKGIVGFFMQEIF